MAYPFIILKEPSSLEIKNIKVSGGFWKHTRADDEMLIIDRTGGFDWKTGAQLIIISFSVSLFMFGKDLFSVSGGLFVGLPLYVIGSFLIWYSFNMPQKAIVLNRANGLITVPRFMWMKSLIFPFAEAYADVVYANVSEGIIGSQFNCTHKSNTKKGGEIIAYHYDETWSQYVWYMDKNRPLPPGTAFDAYRQKDFERRKAERFPKPLYKSNIPTPEATPEQQKEREKYWKG